MGVWWVGGWVGGEIEEEEEEEDTEEECMAFARCSTWEMGGRRGRWVGGWVGG